MSLPSITCIPFHFENENYCSEDDILENTTPNLLSFSLSNSSSNRTNTNGVLSSTNKKTSGREGENNYLYSIQASGVCSVSQCTIEERTSSNGRYETYQTKSELSSLRSQSFLDIYHYPVPTEMLVGCCPSLEPHGCIESYGQSVIPFSLISTCKTDQYERRREGDEVEMRGGESNPVTPKTVPNEMDLCSVLSQMGVSSNMQSVKEKLHCTLNEQDTFLQEIQTNYLSLLLENAEAKNKIDQLRFSSLGPQHEERLVQSEIQSNYWSPVLESSGTSNKLFSSKGSQVKEMSMQADTLMNAQEETPLKNDICGRAKLFEVFDPQLYNESRGQSKRKIVPKHSMYLPKKKRSYLTLSSLKLCTSESIRRSLRCLEDCDPSYSFVALQTDYRGLLNESSMRTLPKGSLSLNSTIEKATFWCSSLSSSANLGLRCNISISQENFVSSKESQSNLYKILTQNLKKNKCTCHLPNIIKFVYNNMQLCQTSYSFTPSETLHTSTQYKSIEINEESGNSKKPYGTCTFDNRRSSSRYYKGKCCCKMMRQLISHAGIRRASSFYSSYHSGDSQVLSSIVQYINSITHRVEATKKRSAIIHNFLKTLVLFPT